MLIRSKLSQLLIVDVQERLAAAMAEREELVRHCGVLLDAAAIAGVPVTLSEQYPRGLGVTVAALANRQAAAARLAKMEFSCLRNEAIDKRLKSGGRGQLIVAGIEAHVCVLQTALDAKAADFDVFVVADAVASRRTYSRDMALQRLAGPGVHVVTTEMVVFEWAETASAGTFKPLSALVR